MHPPQTITTATAIAVAAAAAIVAAAATVVAGRLAEDLRAQKVAPGPFT